MHNVRFRLMAGLAGATLCLFAATSYGQNTNTPTSAPTTAQPTGTDAGTVGAQAGTTGNTNAQTTPDAGATTTGTVTGTTATDAVTTTTTTRTFPGGTLGMLAVAVLVLLVLFALFRGRDRTVVRETYASSSTTAPTAGSRNVTTGTTSEDRMNLNSRAASGTGTPGGINDPNARS